MALAFNQAKTAFPGTGRSGGDRCCSRLQSLARCLEFSETLSCTILKNHFKNHFQQPLENILSRYTPPPLDAWAHSSLLPFHARLLTELSAPTSLRAISSSCLGRTRSLPFHRWRTIPTRLKVTFACHLYAELEEREVKASHTSALLKRGAHTKRAGVSWIAPRLCLCVRWDVIKGGASPEWRLRRLASQV